MNVASQFSGHEIAAGFVATLAFSADEAKLFCLGNFLIDLFDRQTASFLDEPKGKNLRRDKIKGERLLKDATRIISSERLIAAKMAYPKFHAAWCDQLGLDRPSDMPTPCSMEMISAVSADLSHPGRQRDARGRKPTGGEAECNKGNIQNRCWKRSLPVLHMALALHIETLSADIKGFNVGDLFADRQLTNRLVQKSLQFQPIVGAIFKTGNDIPS